MKILILTDHSGHSEHNSVYKIANAIWQREEVDSLYMASRGDERNMLFFKGEGHSVLYAVEYSEEMVFPAHQVFIKNDKTYNLDFFDVIFLRLPRPIPDGFFDFLRKYFNEKFIINNPTGIEKTGNKSFLLEFDKHTVPMQLCKSLVDIQGFRKKYNCVLKPLEAYGGQGIVRIVDGSVQVEGESYSWEEWSKWYADNRQDYLAMKYLKRVSQGDKRIVVASGEVLTASLRIPGPGQWLCNVAQGGRDEHALPDKTELEIIEYVQPKLAREGIFYYGLDTLEDDDGTRVISEINTLSIGGIAPAEIKTGEQLSAKFAALFIRHIQSLKSA